MGVESTRFSLPTCYSGYRSPLAVTEVEIDIRKEDVYYILLFHTGRYGMKDELPVGMAFSQGLWLCVRGVCTA